MRHGMPRVLGFTLALALSACGGKANPPPPAGQDAGNTGCQIASDCGDPRQYDCVATACVPACTVKADCVKHPAYQNGPWPGCASGLCVCDARRCVPSACSDDSECGSQVCKSGSCTDPDLDPDSCAVSPDAVVLRVGERATFAATAYKNNKVVRLGANPFTWTAGDASVTTVDANGGFAGLAASGGWKASAIQAAVRSKPAVTCTAKVLVLGDPGASARVVVVDELTGRTVTGATVVLGAATLAEDATTPGVYLGAKPAGPFTVSVFDADYEYVTVVGATLTDLLIPIRRNQDGTKGGGFTGKFTNLPTTDIAFGLTGTSIPGNYTDLDPSVLLGTTAETSITFAGKTFTADLPSSGELAIGNNAVKTSYAAWGSYGVCAQEDDVVSGSCGTRTGFGLMGTIPVDAATPIFNQIMDKQPVDLGHVIGVAMPFLQTFTSAITRDVTYKLKGVPTDPTVLYNDPEAFARVNFTPTIALELRQIIDVPVLPTAAGTQLDAAIVIAASQVPGQGLVPLGLSAGSDTNADCGAACPANGTLVGIDVVSSNPVQLAYHDDGKLNLRMAPNHDGIEGSRYGLVTLALPSTGTLVNGAAVTTALALNSQSLPDGTEVSYPLGFLGFVESASYDYRGGAFSAVQLVEGASVHRAVFVAQNNRRWTVYFNGTGFTMPAPPAGFEDRTMADKGPRASSTGGRAGLQYWALRAQDGATKVGVDELFDFNAGRAAALSDYLNGFSLYEADPSLSFVSPSGSECGQDPLHPDNCAVDDGTYTFKVKVNAFKVPDQAKLLFTASTGEQVLVAAMGTDWVASAQFKTPLQKDDTGYHTVTVQMVAPNAIDEADAMTKLIDPGVSASLQVVVEN